MSDEETVDEEHPEPPKWERREFAINDSMKKVIEASKVATQAEIAALKRKLKKLQYGG